VICLSRSAVAKQLDDWRVLPRPERLTELYFANQTQLPTHAAAGTPQVVSFVIHNLEHQTTRYQYTAATVGASSEHKTKLTSATVTLNSGQSRTITLTLLLPVTSERTAVEIDLDYTGITAGSNVPRPETQAIRYWLDLANGSRS